MFGDADAAGAGRVYDEDPARAGGGDVDIVDAGAGTGDNAKAGRGLEKRRVDLRGAADHERVSVREIGGEGNRRPAGTGVDLPAAFCAQEVECGIREIVGDDYFQGGVLWCPALGA